MSYVVQKNGDIIVSGFEGGIGDSPYNGITDERNVDIISVPGEAAITFATSKISAPLVGPVTVTSSSGSVMTFNSTAGLENNMAIYFPTITSGGTITINTVYWIGNVTLTTATVYSDYKLASPQTISGSLQGTFSTYNMGVAPSYVTGATSGGPTYFAQPTNVVSSYFTFLVDRVGMVWSNFKVTGTNSYWTYTGNIAWDGGNVSNANGNGLVYWRVSNNLKGSDSNSETVDYLFVFRNSQIDYFVAAKGGNHSGPATGVWVYGWDPTAATTGNTNYLTTAAGTNNSHEAFTPPDNRVYFCDANNIQKFFQTASGTLFDPTNAATFTYTTFNLLPANDIAQCLTYLGNNVLIGGQGNEAYQWNTTSNSITNPIPLAESFVWKMVTVNTNTYMFVGNRGRIYITNGTQANLYKKLPDHISNTIEPNYQWGGATSNKNQLYFSAKVVTNSGSAVTGYGGIWAVDLDSNAIRLSNLLSYGTYTGYATALTFQLYNPVISLSPTGGGLFAGWDTGSSSYGLDQSSSSPYTGGQAFVTTDMIPVGTLLKPATSHQIEFKLTQPLVSGESVTLYQGSYLDMTYASFATLGTLAYSASLATGNLLAANFPIQQQNQQWLLVRAVLTGTASNPSYNRLKEIRIIEAQK